MKIRFLYIVIILFSNQLFSQLQYTENFKKVFKDELAMFDAKKYKEAKESIYQKSWKKKYEKLSGKDLFLFNYFSIKLDIINNSGSKAQMENTIFPSEFYDKNDGNLALFSAYYNLKEIIDNNIISSANYDHFYLYQDYLKLAVSLNNYDEDLKIALEKYANSSLYLKYRTHDYIVKQLIKEKKYPEADAYIQKNLDGTPFDFVLHKLKLCLLLSQPNQQAIALKYLESVYKKYPAYHPATLNLYGYYNYWVDQDDFAFNHFALSLIEYNNGFKLADNPEHIAMWNKIESFTLTSFDELKKLAVKSCPNFASDLDKTANNQFTLKAESYLDFPKVVFVCQNFYKSDVTPFDDMNKMLALASLKNRDFFSFQIRKLYNNAKTKVQQKSKENFKVDETLVLLEQIYTEVSKKEGIVDIKKHYVLLKRQDEFYLNRVVVDLAAENKKYDEQKYLAQIELLKVELKKAKEAGDAATSNWYYHSNGGRITESLASQQAAIRKASANLSIASVYDGLALYYELLGDTQNAETCKQHAYNNREVAADIKERNK